MALRPVAVIAMLLTPLVPVSAFAQSIPSIERATGACVDCAVDGWIISNLTPDVIVGNGPWPGGTWTVSDVTGGPKSGANMQMMLSSGTAGEAVATTITGLVIGQSYTVSISYQSMTLSQGATPLFRGGSFSLTVNGSTTLYPTLTGDSWATAAVTFTATATTAPVVMAAWGIGPSGGILGAVVADDARITPVNPAVPVPLGDVVGPAAAGLLVLTGLLGLAYRQRRHGRAE